MYVLCLFLSVSFVECVFAQNFPVFIGRSTPAVPGPQYVVQTQFGSRNNVPALPRNRGRAQVQRAGSGQQQAEPWAPGEPEWFFPSSPQQWLSSCQRRGCSEVGTHCVFWGNLCPNSVRRVPCRCQRGCRVETYYIPYGQTRVMDRCNNICACNSREGVARCSTRRC